MYLIYPASDASLHWTERWKYYYYAYHGKTQKTERNHVRLHMRDNSLVVPSILFPDLKRLLVKDNAFLVNNEYVRP